mmetsp:Transcript_24452/g.43385  ORF Transcript_24452/g.43385 Transcript_24452/m.43385 type:complete len:94 (+) Transcript_24452:163-444(+)
MSANTEVKSTDMDKKMLEVAIRVATAAFNKFPDSQAEVASYVKTEFDSRYGPNWHCIVGRNYVAKVSLTTTQTCNTTTTNYSTNTDMTSNIGK